MLFAWIVAAAVWFLVHFTAGKIYWVFSCIEIITSEKHSGYLGWGFFSFCGVLVNVCLIGESRIWCLIRFRL